MFQPTRRVCRGLALLVMGCLSQGALAELREHPVVHTFLPTAEEIRDRDGSPALTAFGSAVAIRNSTAVIGMSGIGKVAVFQRSAPGWTRVAELHPPEPVTSFGAGVAYRENTIVVSAYQALFVYKLVNGTWRFASKIPSPTTVVLHGSLVFQDNTIAMGYMESGYGFVYVYELSSSGQVLRTSVLAPSEPSFNDGFGADIAMSSKTLVIGAPGIDGGSAYIFKRNTRGWNQFQKLVGTDSRNEGFGGAVGINNNVIVIGAAGEDPEGGDGTGPIAGGAAFVFTPGSNGLYVERQRIRPRADERDNYELFGQSIYMSDNRLAIGAQISQPELVDPSGIIFTYTLSNGRANSLGVALFDRLEWSGGFANNWLLVGGEEQPNCYDQCDGQALLFDVNRLR